MEIEGEDGSVTVLKEGSKAAFGRGSGLDSNDRTVSRSHVVFQVESKTEAQTGPRVSFQVIGKNPIWVRKEKEGGEIKVFRRLEGGKLAADDWFCISSRTPAWFHLKKIGDGEEERDLGSENGTVLGGDSGSIDVSQIDPVKEFGFLVIGREFECYPKQKLRGVKNWDWFLEEPERDSDEGESKRKRSVGSRKRKKSGGGNDIDEDDDDWSGGSEEDKEAVAKIRKVERPKYLTRARDRGKPGKATRSKKSSESSSRKGVGSEEQEVEKEEEDDEKLGGFIVDNEEEEVEQQVEESDEEDEFIDDDEEE